MDMRATIPVSQALARGERIEPEDFEGLRDVSTALLAGFDLGKPLVAAVNGHARAGGFDLLLAAELRVAVPHATFALEEVALGLYPTGNATVLLPRQIGWVARARAPAHGAADRRGARARDRAPEPRGRRRPSCSTRPSRSPTRSPRTRRSRCARRARGVRELLALPLDEAYRRQEEIGRPLRKTDDAREAQAAFVEKRKPRLEGR